MLSSPGHWRHEHVLLCDQLAARAHLEDAWQRSSSLGEAVDRSAVTPSQQRIARFLQQITFNADCTFFVKKVWRMSPQPVSTCTVRCTKR